MKRAVFVVVPLLLVLFSSCTNPLKAGEWSDKSVADFHQKLDQAQFHEMYVGSAPEFQQASSEKEITDLFNAIHTKLGNVVTSNRTNIFMSATTGGNFVRTTYDTTFANGKGQETFNWRLVNDQLTLVGYNIESRDLITK